MRRALLCVLRAGMPLGGEVSSGWQLEQSLTARENAEPQGLHFSDFSSWLQHSEASRKKGLLFSSESKDSMPWW